MNYCSPLFEPPAPDVGPGDDTTARYVGGGGGGGVLWLPWLASLDKGTVSSSLVAVKSVFLGCSSLDGIRGGGVEHVDGPSVGGVLAFGAGPTRTLEEESIGGGEEAGGDASSFGSAQGGEVASERGLWTSGVRGYEGAGGAVGSSEDDGEAGRVGRGSSFGGGDSRRGGAWSSGGGGDVGKGGAGD